MKEFIKSMLTSGSGTSSKRTMGVLGLIIYYFIVFVLSTLAIWINFNIPDKVIALLDTQYWGSIALLGLGVVEPFFKNKT